MPSHKFQQRKLLSEKSPSAAATIKDAAPQASTSKTSWSRDNSSDEEDASRKTAQIGEARVKFVHDECSQISFCMCVCVCVRACVCVWWFEVSRRVGVKLVLWFLVQEWAHLLWGLLLEEGS